MAGNLCNSGLFDEMKNKVIFTTRYLPWLELSDKYPWLIRICETVAHLVCHASKLKLDDARLKGLMPSHKMYVQCDSYLVEYLHHIVMHCPNTESYMSDMLKNIVNIDETNKYEFEENPSKVFSWLIGKDIPRPYVQSIDNFR